MDERLELTEFAFKRKLKDEIPPSKFLTHNLYSHPAKFIPHVPYYIIKKYTKESNGIILDPFSGSSSTAVEALRAGHNSVCIDINPLMDFVARLKTQHIGYQLIESRPEISLEKFLSPQPIDRTKLKDKISIAKLITRIKNYEGKEFIPSWSNIDHWYPPEFKKILVKMWGYVHYESHKDYPEDFLYLLKSTALYMARYLSYGARDVPKLFKSKSRIKQVELLREKVKNNPEWVYTVFRKKIFDNYKQILKLQEELQNKNITPIYEKTLSLETVLPSNNNERKIVCLGNTDALEYQYEIKNEFIDMIITSPPYIYAQEYIRSTKLDMYWMGIVNDEKVRAVTRKELGQKKKRNHEPKGTKNKKTSEPIAIDSNLKRIKSFMSIFEIILKEERKRYGKNGKYSPQVHNFFADLYDIIAKLTKKLKKGGIFGFFVGNPTVLGHMVLCSNIFYDIFVDLGYEICEFGYDEIISRQLLKGRRNDSPEGMDCEWLIIARK